MLKFLCGVIVGIAATTVGFVGMAKMADRGVSEVQKIITDASK